MGTQAIKVSGIGQERLLAVHQGNGHVLPLLAREIRRIRLLYLIEERLTMWVSESLLSKTYSWQSGRRTWHCDHVLEAYTLYPCISSLAYVPARLLLAGRI